MNVRNTLVLKLLVKRSQIHSYSDSNTYSDSKSHRFLRKGNVYCISFFQVNSLTPPVSKFPMILRGGSIWEILLWWRLNIFLTMFLHGSPSPCPAPPAPCLAFFSFSFYFFKLSFISGKMRTAAWETTPQIVLRNCSKEAVGKINM